MTWPRESFRQIERRRVGRDTDGQAENQAKTDEHVNVNGKAGTDRADDKQGGPGKQASLSTDAGRHKRGTQGPDGSPYHHTADYPFLSGAVEAPFSRNKRQRPGDDPLVEAE